uniref:Uncharacterized protein n=1 Tax=Anguilla anguilla TaxID=7936 RepID=A0A0E9WWA9_ANGAN
MCEKIIGTFRHLEEFDYHHWHHQGQHSSGGKTDCLAVGGLPVQTPPWACRSVLEQDS